MLITPSVRGAFVRFHEHDHYARIVLLCLCWYAISSVASQVTKQILTEFPFPLFLGEFQFLYISMLAVLTCWLARKWRGFFNLFPSGTFPDYSLGVQSRVITPPSRHIIQVVLPLGLFQFVGKYFGHKATSLVPISTVSSIKTLSPIFILVAQQTLHIDHRKLNVISYLSLSCILSGVWLIVSDDNKRVVKEVIGESDIQDSSATATRLSRSSSGVCCAIVSMLVFVAQNMYGKQVFTNTPTHVSTIKQSFKESSPLPLYSEKKFGSLKSRKYDKLTLMIYISAVGFVLSFGWFLTLELPTVWRLFYHNDSETVSFPVRLLLLNGLFHFIQTMIAYYLLGEISTLSYSIANLMKRISVIFVSWLISCREITPTQVTGLSLNAIGLFLYERNTKTQKK